LIHYGFPPVAFVFNLSITGFDRNGSFFYLFGQFILQLTEYKQFYI